MQRKYNLYCPNMLIGIAESMSVHKLVYACMHPDWQHIVSGLVLQRHSECKV